MAVDRSDGGRRREEFSSRDWEREREREREREKREEVLCQQSHYVTYMNIFKTYAQDHAQDTEATAPMGHAFLLGTEYVRVRRLAVRPRRREYEYEASYEYLGYRVRLVLRLVVRGRARRKK